MFCASIRAQKIVADKYIIQYILYTQTEEQQKITHTDTSFLLTRNKFQGLGFGRHSQLGSSQRQRRRHSSAPQQPQLREHHRRHLRTATDLQRKGLLRRLHTRSQLPPVDRSQDFKVPVRNPQMCLVQEDGGVWIGSVSGSTFPWYRKTEVCGSGPCPGPPFLGTGRRRCVDRVRVRVHISLASLHSLPQPLTVCNVLLCEFVVHTDVQ